MKEVFVIKHESGTYFHGNIIFVEKIKDALGFSTYKNAELVVKQILEHYLQQNVRIVLQIEKYFTI